MRVIKGDICDKIFGLYFWGLYPSIGVSPNGWDHSNRLNGFFWATIFSFDCANFYYHIVTAWCKELLRNNHPAYTSLISFPTNNRALVVIAMSTTNEHILVLTINYIGVQKNVILNHTVITLTPFFMKKVPFVRIDTISPLAMPTKICAAKNTQVRFNIIILIGPSRLQFIMTEAWRICLVLIIGEILEREEKGCQHVLILAWWPCTRVICCAGLDR